MAKMSKQEQELQKKLDRLYELRQGFEEYTKLEAEVKAEYKEKAPGGYSIGDFQIVVATRKRTTYDIPEAIQKKYTMPDEIKEKYAVEGTTTVVTWTRSV